ncbi:VTC domain-containing protein [Purpureocillium lilacinum]|uniref:VTC domain-containing protein n=1 Tax=Purpureocillium lilacinum TaxID=33203 RepID=A0A179HGJ2_PURLI|nr:VTC domain-containing protein [Purpureocillium lilacinum]OAQ79862.1 VTC domain-containing protein [Purpureocillium lilacinum]OAQ88738.1 VTC domain-containing protein [Purpureocillium lilacinum]
MDQGADDDRDRKPKKKVGFLGGLLRSGSFAFNKGTKDNKKHTRRVSEGDVTTLRKVRPDPPPRDRARSRRRPRRPDPDPHAGTTAARALKGKGVSVAADDVDDEYDDHAPAAVRVEWPPRGMSADEELPPQHALELICRGASLHKGHKKAVPHAPDSYYTLYATSSGNRGAGSDAANLHDAMAQLMTLRMLGQGHASYPWETLEQPSCAFMYGRRPGTITLNHWASMASVVPPAIALRDAGVEPRPMDLFRIFERLKELQSGLEDDDEGLLYKILYRRILRDPDRMFSPHRTLDKQITDLILVLSRPDWIDFTDPKNHVATRFVFDRGEGGREDRYRTFFHQLLLSLELELRIHSAQHGDWAKEKLLQQIPPTIQWSLALARRWREYVRVDEFGDTPDKIKLRYKLKKRQVKMLKRFAQMMKWPNLGGTLDNLKEKDDAFALDAISSDAFAFFSGLVFPGPSFPFLIMNTLIDLDPDPATDNLALLSHTHPQCGFQYRNSHTYWSASCIVGKVLAPTCRCVGGWVGPGRPTADLGRSQIARIRSRRPRQPRRRMGPEDVESMGERSDPLGPPADTYPIGDYELARPKTDEGFEVDTVRIELLGFRPSATQPSLEEENGNGAGGTGKAAVPQLFDATIQFAIDGLSWPLRLMYDVSFISAWPCSDGPHPLFFDYVYKAIQVDDIVRVRDWGGLYARQRQSATTSARSSPAPPPLPPNGNLDDYYDQLNDEEEQDEEKVLVVEAFGVRDNEVLARAWCSHWGLSAVVADVDKTCMACAIREAYAATLTVVILVDDRLHGDDGNEA